MAIIKNASQSTIVKSKSSSGSSPAGTAVGTGARGGVLVVQKDGSVREEFRSVAPSYGGQADPAREEAVRRGGGSGGSQPQSSAPVQSFNIPAPVQSFNIPATAIQSTNLDVIQKDIPARMSLQPSGIEVIRRQSLQRNFRGQETYPNLIKDRKRNLFDKFLGRPDKQTRVENEMRTLRIGSERPAYRDPNLRGTQPSFRDTPLPSKEFRKYDQGDVEILTTSGQVSREAGLSTLAQIQQKKYGVEFTNDVENYASVLGKSSQNIINAEARHTSQLIEEYKQDLVFKVQEGKISSTTAQDQLDRYVSAQNKRLEGRGEKITAENKKLVNDFADKWVEEKGANLEKSSNAYLEKVSDKTTLNRVLKTVPLFIAGGAVIGATAASIAAIGPVSAAIVSATGTTLNIVGATAAGAGIYSAVKSGTLSVRKVASTIVPFLALGIGAKFGAAGATKLINNARLGQSNKIKSAVERATIESFNPKGISGELEIKNIQIPEGEKAKLLSSFKAGESIRKFEARIKPRNELDRKLIEDNIDIKIEGYQKLNQAGKWVDVVSITKVQVKPTVSSKLKSPEFEELTLSKLQGVNINNKAILKGFELSTSQGQIKLTPAAQIIKSKIIKMSPSGRITESRGVSFRGPETNIGKNITFKDIERATLHDINKLSVYSKGKSAQVDIQTGKPDTLGIKYNDQYLLAINKKFASAGVGKSSPLVEPISFKRGSTTRKMKPFKFEEPKVEFKLPKETLNNNQILSKTSGGTRTITESFVLKETPIDAQLKKAQAAVAKSFDNIEKAQGLKLKSVPSNIGDILSENKFANLTQGKDSLLNFDRLEKSLSVDLSSASPTNLLLEEKFNPRKKQAQNIIADVKAIPDFNILQDLFPKTKQFPSGRGRGYQKQNFSPATSQIPQLRTPQITIEQLIPKLKQPSPQIHSPSFKVPPFDFNFKVPPPPFGGGSSGAGSKLKKLYSGEKKRKVPKYTSSFEAAALQTKPFKVTKNQLKKLNVQSFSGFETRPVLEIIDDKETKKLIKKLNF